MMNRLVVRYDAKITVRMMATASASCLCLEAFSPRARAHVFQMWFRMRGVEQAFDWIRTSDLNFTKVLHYRCATKARERGA